MKIYYKGARTMFAECPDKVCPGKLMILTIKIAPECATFDTERGGTQSSLYCSMRAIAEGGMSMLRFINYQNIVSVNFDHAQKFQNYVQMSETSANAEALEAVGGAAGEKLEMGFIVYFARWTFNSRLDYPRAQSGHCTVFNRNLTVAVRL